MSYAAVGAAGHDVSRLVAQAAVESPARVAVAESTGRSLTWQALEDEVARVAGGLAEAGLVAGQRVVLVLGNRLEFVTAYLGVLRAQVVAVPVNPGSTPDELARMLADCRARVVVAEDATLARVREALEQGVADHVAPRVVVVGEPDRERAETSYADLCRSSAQPVPALPDPEKLAVLLYTSGTSGRPRAAMLTHRALLANLEQVAAVEPPMIHGDDVVLGVLPLFHVYGLNAVLGGVLRHRARLVLVDRWDAQEVLDLVEDEACSVLPLAPPALRRWLSVPDVAERLGPARLVLSGSAPLDAETVERFTELAGVPVHQGYGLTEASPVVTSTLCRGSGSSGPGSGGERDRHPVPGSVGAALPGIELRLVDESGRTPAAGDAGEISVRGDNLFSGYWPDGADGPDVEGWWATGDLGFLDEAGDLVLVDRVRDLVLVSGFNVYPSEVEDVLREVADVTVAAVVGVPDQDTGEAVVAYVVAAPGAAYDVVAQAARTHAETRLARFKRPSRIEVVAELPTTVTGKVQRGRLRGRARRRAQLLEEGPPE